MASRERVAPGDANGIVPTLREGGRPLLAIVVVALAARSIALNNGLWIDEIYSLLHSFRLPLSGVISTFLGDTHHPLYAIFARISLVLFGEAPWSIRSPAVLFGTAAVPATYLVARLVATRREALLASLLLAVSYHHVWFSQNARGYTLIGFLALLSTWALVRMLDEGSWPMALQYAVLAALAAYTHLTMVFVAVGHAAVALVTIVSREPGRRRIRWQVPAAAFALAAVLTIVFYAPMLGQVLDFFINKPSGLRGTSTPSWAALEAIRVLMFGFGAVEIAAGSVVLLLAALIGLSGFIAIFRERRTVALAFALPPLTVIFGALAGRGTMYPRFFFFAAGMALIVLVRGLFVTTGALRRFWPRIPATGLAMACSAILVAASAASLALNYRYPKQDYAGAMQFVLAAKAPGDVVAFAGVPGDPYRSLYGQDWPTVRTAADIEHLRTGGSMWLIYTFPRYLESDTPEVAEIVRRDCRERAVFRGTVQGGDMIVCTLTPA